MIVRMSFNVYSLNVHKLPKNSFKRTGNDFRFENTSTLFRFSSLSLLNEMALNNSRKHFSIPPKFDLIQLATYLQTLSSSLYNSLKHRFFPQQINHRQLSIQLELTKNETCALEVTQTSFLLHSISREREKNV